MYKFLYIVYMNNLFDVFTSQAIIKILRVLYFQPEGIPLRHIGHISQLPIYSVQHGIKKLLKDSLVTRRKQGQNQLYEMNKSHVLREALAVVFSIEMNLRLSQGAAQYSDRAQRTLSFSNSVQALFKHKRQNDQ
jgi:DNA-binding transcriptional ArsR family regulator